MIRYFNKSIVLTSDQPQGFANFVYESSDTSVWYIIPQVDTSLDLNRIFVNGLDLNGGIDPSNLFYEPSINFALIVDYSGDPSIASFLITSNYIMDYEHNLTFNIFDTPDISSGTLPFESVDVSIYIRPNIISGSDINLYETTNVQSDGDTSYLLMRTNPKFSGNIKLVADSSNRIYLDTFKVSDVLSNKKYRRQIVSGNSVFSGDVRRVFGDLPLGELYRLDNEDVLDISLPKTDLFDQYDLNYSYGSRLFKDELYSEDYAMLAPLWINKNIPSYFAIFRLDGVYNEETYEDGGDLSVLGEKYISGGDLLSTWSLKEASPIGTYMRNHVKEVLQFRSPVFLSLTDPAQTDFDPNTWYGIAVDKGIMTGRSEVPYFFNQKAGNFTDMNAFISEGFERNNLLIPNLINMEYVFDDEEVDLYTMHRYFGLYLTENELYKISYYADASGGDIRILSLDGRDSSIFFNSSIFDPCTGDVVDEYSNRIFGLDDVLTFNRITNKSHANGSDYSAVQEWVNKPGNNLFSAPVEKRQFNDFVTLKINNLLNPGEHLRIINKTQNIIWEIYGSNWDIINAGESINYASVVEEDGYPTLYRTMFSTKGSISDQIVAIQKAFNVFEDYEGTPFKSGIRKTDTFSLLIKDEFIGDQYQFQRITSNVSYSCGSTYTFNTGASPSDISFFGRLTPSSEDIEIVSCDSSFGPINFELFGNRQSIMFDFIDPSTYSIYSLSSIYKSLFQDFVMYLSENDEWYRLIRDTGVEINETNIYNYLYVEDPVESNDNIIVMTQNLIKLVNGNIWNAYAVYPLIVSLMGINPVKDIDYTVYDSSIGYESEYWYDRSDDPSTYFFSLSSSESKYIDTRGSYNIISGSGVIQIGDDSSIYYPGFKFNTFFGDASIMTSSNTVITYNTLDGSANFPSYVPGSSEEDLNDYYWDPDTKTFLKYSLTVPTVSKWVGLGTDARGNPLRLILNGDIFESSTNFIPYNGWFENEISYPSFKYLDSGDRAWESYVYFDINDTVSYTEDSSVYYRTLRNFMIENPEIDVFSKILYFNKDVAGTFVRSSIVYYNQYKDTAEGIINGLNLSLAVSPSAKNILDIKDWDRYRFSLISTPSRNRNSNSPMEVIINENTETILIIWYQGNDLLNYTYRNSSELPGKNILDDDSLNVKWQAFVDGSSNYSYVKAPFFIYTNLLATPIQNIYGSSNSGYPESVCSPFVQYNWNTIDNVNSIFNAYGSNYVTGGGTFTYALNYNTIYQKVDYNFIESSSTIGKFIINQSWQYNTNINQYSDDTTELSSFQYILDNNNIDYYILRGTDLIENSDFVVKPLSISTISPKEYLAEDASSSIYTYLGWYRPKFNSIFNFNGNETDELISIIEKDFTLGNTYFRSYNDIPQFWFNRVVENINSTDISIGNAISFLESWNVFKAQWDAEYYTLGREGDESLVDGYNSALEMPSFFGSKLIKLPNVFELEDWDVTTASSQDGNNWNTLEFNLTRNIINSFKSNEIFIENWSDLTNSDNVIDGYIKETIVSYYNITRPKIGVNIWVKPYDGRRLYYELDNSFEKIETKNVDGFLNFINGDYIYSINVDLLPDLSYYISFTLVEK